MSLSVGFLGTGRIAAPMVRSLSRRLPDCAIRISGRNREISGRLSELSGVTVMENQDVVDRSEIVFLCLLADVARSELPGLDFRGGQKIISVMADISLAEVGNLVLPATDPVVTVPLPFIETGGCPLPVFPDGEVMHTLFGDENEVIPVNAEAAMGPHFAATAILSHTMKQLDVVADWLSGFTGSRQDAERYVASLLTGYLESLEKDGNGRFHEAMEDLSTEGGLNNQLRAHIGQSGFYETLHLGLDQLATRLRERAPV